jgi:pilus assembly protein CpaE
MRSLLVMKNVEQMQSIQSKQTEALQIEYINKTDQFFERLVAGFDVVMVHTELFFDIYPWDWMSAIKKQLPNAKVWVFYDLKVYDSTMLDIIDRLAAEFGFNVIPSGMSIDEVETTIIEILKNVKNGNKDRNQETQNVKNRNGQIVTIWSADSKDGGSTIALNTGLALASRNTEHALESKTDLRIGLLDLNLHHPTVLSNLNLRDREKTNVKIRPSLMTNTLTKVELLENCVSLKKLPQFHILGGSPRRETAEDFTPEMVHNLLQVAKTAFDITLVDVHTYPNNGATITAVREADHRWLVTQNNFASYKISWGEWYECFWKYCGLKPSDISLILNRVTSEDKGKIEQIADLLQMKKLAEIPNVPGGLGVRAVDEGIPLYFRNDVDDFNNQIGLLATSLTNDSIIDGNVKRKKHSFFKKILNSISS